MTDLRKLLAAATPGPWELGKKRVHGISAESVDGYHTVCVHSNDAALIAALVNVAPLLLNVVDAARAHQTATATATLHPTYPNVEAMHHSWQAVDRALAALDKATEPA